MKDELATFRTKSGMLAELSPEALSRKSAWGLFFQGKCLALPNWKMQAQSSVCWTYERRMSYPLRVSNYNLCPCLRSKFKEAAEAKMRETTKLMLMEVGEDEARKEDTAQEMQLKAFLRKKFDNLVIAFRKGRRRLQDTRSRACDCFATPAPCCLATRYVHQVWTWMALGSSATWSSARP